MTTAEWDIKRDGFRILPRAVDADIVERLLSVFDDAFTGDSRSVSARSIRGHVYAARNLIESIPEVTTVWQSEPMLGLLREVLGDDLGSIVSLGSSLSSRPMRVQLPLRMIFGIVLLLPTNASAQQKHALLVAVGEYQRPEKIGTLKYPEADAKALKAVLERVDGSGYLVTLLLGREATAKAVLTALEEISNSISMGNG